MNYLFFDLETTGLSQANDKVIEIAAIVVNVETKKMVDTFQTFVNPGISIPPFIQAHTSITNQMVVDAPTEIMAFEEFASFIKKHDFEVIAGHNIDSFDMGWLRGRNEKYELGLDLDVETLDTLKYVKEVAKTGSLVGYDFTTKKGNVSYKLEYLMEYFELGTQNHRAINDVENNIKVYFNLREMESSNSSLGF